MPSRLPRTYLLATARVADYFFKIQKGTAPPRFTREYLENLGFKAKNDRSLIPFLKELGFIDASNVPTQVYRDYLDESRARTVLGQQVLKAYEALFELDRNSDKSTVPELNGRFKSLSNVSENLASTLASNFLSLCKMSDLEAARGVRLETPPPPSEPSKPDEGATVKPAPAGALTKLTSADRSGPANLAMEAFHYHIEIHLPNTTDTEVFRAIFKALKEHLQQ